MAEGAGSWELAEYYKQIAKHPPLFDDSVINTIRKRFGSNMGPPGLVWQISAADFRISSPNVITGGTYEFSQFFMIEIGKQLL